MNRSTLSTHVEEILAFLRDGGTLLVPPEHREQLVRRAEDLLGKTREPGETLHVAIAGGTGVGKSTLINALAGKEISHASDRRPYTDRAVVYRHRETTLGMEVPAELIRDPDALHDCDAVKDLVLFDLPDFDSHEENNRRTVLRLVPAMDAIIWVASPEKYADAVFYEMVRGTAIHRENFTFVFNKADELLQEGTTDPHARLKEVLGDLTFRLKHDAGIEQPRIFSISAMRRLSGADEAPFLDAEFQRFRDFLMVRRDAKEIASIKTVNLVEETRRLIEDLGSLVRPEEKSALCSAIRAETAEAAMKAPGSALFVSGKHRAKLSDAIHRVFISADGSITPVKLAMRLLRPARFEAGPGTPEQVFAEAAAAGLKTRRTDIESVSARVESELLLAFPDSAGPASPPSPELVMTRAGDDATLFCSMIVENYRRSLTGPLSRVRRFWQKLVVLSPIPLCFLTLVRYERIEQWLDQPSFTGTFRLALGFLTSLFTVEGLAALLALLVFQALFILGLASRRNRKLQKTAGRLAQETIAHLDGKLNEAAERIRLEQEERLGRMERSLEQLRDLRTAVH